jgi:erythromycin 3''-O-methyltransferase
MLGSVKKIGRVLRAVTTRDPERRVRLLYQLADPDIQFADRTTMYTNIGYWPSDATTVDEAGEAIAVVLADAAGIEPGQDVLDVGCGYGEQDFLWLREKCPRAIHAMDLAPHQIERARDRAAAEELGDRLDFRVGSATDLPFADASFDRVVSLDAPMHFHTRAEFFAEAYRVLRPGGVLATVDTLPLDATKPRTLFRTPRFSLYRFGIPDANWYDRDTYSGELARTGFVDGRVASIREHSWEPWFRHWSRLATEPAALDELAPEVAATVAKEWRDRAQIRRELDLLDYVLGVAVKPGPDRARI